MEEDKRYYAKRVGQEVTRITTTLTSKLVKIIEHARGTRHMTQREVIERYIKWGIYSETDYKRTLAELAMPNHEFFDMIKLEQIPKLKDNKQQ